APCPRGCSSARSDSASEAYRQGAPTPSACSSNCGLLLLCFEEAQKRRMLREVVLDLGDPGPGPVLEPGLGEVVLDAMEAAFAHAGMIDSGRADRHGPFGSTWEP